jgi:hypothetical protein
VNVKAFSTGCLVKLEIWYSYPEIIGIILLFNNNKDIEDSHSVLKDAVL